jgi:hypothetical protein
MVDFDDIRKLATRPTRVVSLCLAGDLVEQIDQLERQLADAKPPVSLGDASPKRLIAEQIVALQDQMRESTVDFHLRALPSRKWSHLLVERPERKENEPAQEWEPRLFAWQAEVTSQTCVDPVMTAEQVGELVDELHFKAWAELSTACYLLNMGDVDIPNSEAASELIGTSEQTSRRQPQPESPTASSAARRPSPKRRTSTRTAG